MTKGQRPCYILHVQQSGWIQFSLPRAENPVQGDQTQGLTNMTELWDHVWIKVESMANETFLKPSERHGLPYTRGQSRMLQAGKDVRATEES